MAFCGSCGKPTSPDDHFCKACGAPVKATVAAAPTTPVVPTTTPPAPQQYAAVPAQSPSPIPPPVRRSHVGLWLLGVFAVLALLVIVLVVIINSGPKPEDSLDRARAAYLQHDQANFDKYVDVNSVLSDWTDQGVNVWLKQENAGVFATSLVQSIVGSVKSKYLPGLAQSADQMVVSGTAPDQSQASENDPISVFLIGYLSQVIRNAATTQLTYKGVESKTVTNNTDAILRVNVTGPASSQPVTVQIRMRRDGDHWRVVAVDDLAGLLSQLNLPTTP